MRYSIVALAAAFVSVQAFKDTSPFILFSSSPLPDSLQHATKSQLQSRTSILQNAKDFLKDCPSDIYYVLTQPSISSAEIQAWAPHMSATVSKHGVKTRYTVSEASGLEIDDGEVLIDLLSEQCGAKVVEMFKDQAIDGSYTGPMVIRGSFPAILDVTSQRGEQIEDHDSILFRSAFSQLGKDKYTVIYTTTPPAQVVDIEQEKPITYEPIFSDSMHTDLKRDIYPRARNDSGPPSDVRPLFEKYEFLSPGLFMGILVGLILISILYVGISAISGLEVSYGAFDKEMGPAAHKKQQ